MQSANPTSVALLAMLLVGCAVASVPIAGGSAGASTATGPGSGGAGGSSGTSSTTTGGTGGSPPNGSWVNVTANLANMPSECGNLASISAKPDEDMVIAVVALNGLFATTDGGGSWNPLGTGVGSAAITNRMQVIVYDPQNHARFWESGIYAGGGAFETVDDGVTFKQLGNVTHVDLLAVDLTDPDRKTMLAGGHEQSMTLNKSTDGGMTWANIGGGLPANTNCTFPLVIDSNTYVVGCGGYGGGPIGLLRTTDGGTTWTRVSTAGGGAAPLRASDGSIYWTSPNGNSMVRSTDDGVTWTQVTGPNVVTSSKPVELPDGRLGILGKDSVMVSADHGATWTPATSQLPYQDAVGAIYSSQRKAFFVWHLTCGFNGPVPVPADAIMRHDFDYQK